MRDERDAGWLFSDFFVSKQQESGADGLHLSYKRRKHTTVDVVSRWRYHISCYRKVEKDTRIQLSIEAQVGNTGT